MEHRGAEKTDLSMDLPWPRQVFAISSHLSVWACIIANDSDCANLLPELECITSEMSTANLGNERETALGEFPQFIWVIQTNKPYNEKNVQPAVLD